MKPLVFAGPSLHGLTISSCDAFDLAPPAACGDIMRAALGGREIIGLIDGVFESGPAVWHKEILFALAAGQRVFGAASMGALRAAECWQFGMVGIGAIFEDYRTGRRSSDADVALVYGPAELGYMPLSVPLVDVEDWISRLLAAGILATARATPMLQEARRLNFKQRSWERLLTAAGLGADDQRPLLGWITASGPSAKARDALQLLERIADLPPVATKPAPFPHTRFSERLLHSIQG